MSSTSFPKGTDIVLTGQWKDDAGTPVNLTGVTFDLYDVSAGIAPVASVVDAPTGAVMVRIPWVEGRRLGVEFSFRVRLTAADLIKTTTYEARFLYQ